MANVYDDILDDVVTAIEALSISGLADANVIKCKVSRKLKLDSHVAALPCCLVSPFGSVQRSSYSNLKDKVIYPVLVAYIAASGNSQTTNITEHTDALQQIQRTFRPRGAISVSEALVRHEVTEVAPRTTYELPAWFEMYDIGDILLRFHMHEPRSQAA